MKNEDTPDPAMIGTTCDAYCDLHRKRSSLKALTGDKKGRVVGKPHRVVLKDVQFRVLAGGYARCQAEGVRNVHAYARGTIIGGDVDAISTSPEAVRVRYNPLIRDTFFRADDDRPVTGAALFAIEGKTAWAIAPT